MLKFVKHKFVTCGVAHRKWENTTHHIKKQNETLLQCTPLKKIILCKIGQHYIPKNGTNLCKKRQPYIFISCTSWHKRFYKPCKIGQYYTQRIGQSYIK